MRIKIFIPFIILQCTIISFVYAETIILKSGKAINGKIVEKTKDYTKIDFTGTVLTYWSDEIEKIIEENEAKPVQAPESGESEGKEYIEKAAELMRERKFQEAAAYLEEIVQSEPPDVTAYLFLGTTYCNLEKFKEAIDILNKAIIKKPNDIYIYMILTIAYKKNGEREKAKETLNKLISLYNTSGKRGEAYFISELMKDLNW